MHAKNEKWEVLTKSITGQRGQRGPEKTQVTCQESLVGQGAVCAGPHGADKLHEEMMAAQ